MQRLTTYSLNLLLAALVLSLLAGCSRQPPVYSAHFNAFGEIALVTVIGTTHEKARQAVIETQNLLQMLEVAWNPTGEGDLDYTNRQLAGGREFVAPPSVYRLVEMSQDFYRKSNGNFNPAMGKYLELWGVYGEGKESAQIPSDGLITEIMAKNPSISDINREGMRLQTANPDVVLDFGLLKKAYAMELCKQSLVNAGARDALLRIGGDVVTIGSRGGEPWQMSIPREDGTGVLGTMKLGYNETGFTVSANYNTFTRNGKVYHPVIDPKTGSPVTHTMAVTVVHDDPALAAAGSVAIFVSGPEEWEDTAKAMGIRQVLLIDADNVIHVTTELKDRFKFDVSQSQLVVSEL